MASRQKTAPVDEASGLLFSPSAIAPTPVAADDQRKLLFVGGHRVWSENKADLIAKYLELFVFVTRRAVYLDAFAGPHNNAVENWTAKKVLENQRTRKREKRVVAYYLFDIARKKVAALKKLSSNTVGARAVEVHEGDSNVTLPARLKKRMPNAATFCLLDQFTFECEWTTVQAVAEARKSKGMKVELLYFFANDWLPRAVVATRKGGRLRKWWGADQDWLMLKKMPPWERARMLASRFKTELGYAFAEPYPIFKSPRSTRIMYFLVHASDHPEAPKLMDRAYSYVNKSPKEWVQQMSLDEAARSAPIPKPLKPHAFS